MLILDVPAVTQPRMHTGTESIGKEHGNRCLLQYLSRHGTKQKLAYRMMSEGAHHDEAHARSLGFIEDCIPNAIRMRDDLRIDSYIVPHKVLPRQIDTLAG